MSRYAYNLNQSVVEMLPTSLKLVFLFRKPSYKSALLVRFAVFDLRNLPLESSLVAWLQ